MFDNPFETKVNKDNSLKERDLRRLAELGKVPLEDISDKELVEFRQLRRTAKRQNKKRSRSISDDPGVWL